MVHYTVSKILVVVGGLNWGLVGITNLFDNHFDLVEYIGYDLLNMPTVSDVIYLIVGIAAIVMAVEMINRR